MKKLIAIVLLFSLLTAVCSLQCLAQSIDSAEYFFDIDPGAGNGTTLAVNSGDTIADTSYIKTTGLPTGFHSLYVRVKDSNQVWSLYEGGRFYIYDTISQTAPASYPIAAAEYFYDTDPGIGNGTALNAFTPADTVTLTDTLKKDTLAAGTHYLFVRVRDSMQVWSLTEARSFVICNFVPKPDFSADTVCLHSPTTFIDMSSNVDTSFNYTYSWDFNNDHITDDTTKGNTSYMYAAAGTHTVSLIVNNTNGCTDTIIKTVYVDSLPIVTFSFLVDTICIDDTLILSGGLPIGGVYSGSGVYGGALYGDSVAWGYHTITYTYYTADSCSGFATDFIYVSLCTGVHEYTSPGFSVTITPNPFSTTALISLHSSHYIVQNAKLVLFDVFGKEIHNQKLESGTSRLERGALTNGVYFYKVITSEGSFTTGKLVVVD